MPPESMDFGGFFCLEKQCAPDEFALVMRASICQEQTAVVPLAGKYLPEGVPYIEGGNIRKLDNRRLDLMWLPTNNYATLIEQKTLSFQNTNSDGLSYDVIDTVDLVDGQRVRVDFDGVQYELAAVDDLHGNFLVGNGSIINFGPDTGEPFALVFMPDISAAYAVEQKPHTFAMYGEEPNKLPEVFLPDSVGEVILRSSTADSTKRFKLTVDDTGAITVAEVTE